MNHHPPHPITFKHEGVLWYKSANSKSGSANKIDQVDSDIKDLGQSFM